MIPLKLQEQFNALWQPIKDHVLNDIKDLSYSVHGIPNNEIRDEILLHVEKIKELANKEEAFPYLCLSGSTNYKDDE